MQSATTSSSSERPEHPNSSAIPLSRVRGGSSVRIRQLPDSPSVTHRLREIGFCEGQCIKLLTCGSNIICQVCDARLAIRARLAETILVELISLRKAA
ncbi:MAG: ferrous iron transport protein A [Pedosphaera sp.]|nr:ferrous iron transport protein A [Pedosphaera sp.]